MDYMLIAAIFNLRHPPEGKKFDPDKFNPEALNPSAPEIGAAPNKAADSITGWPGREGLLMRPSVRHPRTRLWSIREQTGRRCVGSGDTGTSVTPPARSRRLRTVIERPGERRRVA
jgi:hypothetical protein